MRVCENGIYREMTEKEIEEAKRFQKEWEEQEANRPPTPEEKIAELEKQNEVLTQSLLEMSELVYK